MNPVSQSDLHPGAESLNAFAEQALACQEREQVLAHLVRCGRCRQVVYLAQQAAGELESQPAEVAVARREPLTSSWLTNWRIAWVPAAALATAVALAVLVHVRHIERQTEMATVTPESAPQNEGAVPRPAPPERLETAPSPASSAPAVSAEMNRKLMQPGGESGQPQVMATSNAPPEAAAVPPGASGQALPAAGAAYPFNSEQMQSAQVKTETGVAELQQEQDRSAGASSNQPMPARQVQARTYGAAFEGQANPTLPLSTSAQMLDAEPPPTSATGNQGQLRMAGAAPLRIAKPAPLPSGLTAISTAAAGSRLLAIDSAGTLFLSENSGSTWEPVAMQWTGRAVAVGVRPALSGKASAAPNGVSAAGKSKPALPSAPATVFEIVNDKGQIWSSADGRNWAAQ